MHFHPAASVIAQNWAAIDPSAAIEWARSHSDTQGFQGAMNGAINGWWSKDHGAAEQYVATRATDSAGRQMASTLASYIFAKDPERAKEWVGKLPDLETRRQAEHVLVIQMAVNDPRDASEYAATLPPDVREATLGGAINYWAANDLAAAGEWIKDSAARHAMKRSALIRIVCCEKIPTLQRHGRLPSLIRKFAINPSMGSQRFG
jgi:hypothetical protein